MTILATGMENQLEEEVQANVHSNEDDYYEDLIPKLYKPAKKATMATVITQQELTFEVEPVKEPEPATPEPKPEPEPVDEPDGGKEPTMLDKWKVWLSRFMKDVTE